MSEPNTGGVSVANYVADEIGMRGMEEKIPDLFVDLFEDTGMSALSSCLDSSSSQLGRQIEFFSTARCEEGNNHRVNLLLAENFEQ